MRASAWACFATQGVPSHPNPFIAVASVRDIRERSQKYMGGVWANDGETWKEGWRRAHEAGWRCIEVNVSGRQRSKAEYQVPTGHPDNPTDDEKARFYIPWAEHEKLCARDPAYRKAYENGDYILMRMLEHYANH